MAPGRGRGGGGGGAGRGGADAMRTRTVSGSGYSLTVFQAPPLFPPLSVKPLPLSEEALGEDLLVHRKDILKMTRRSMYFIPCQTQKNDVERYSDRYKGEDSGNKRRMLLCYSSSLREKYFPSELVAAAEQGGYKRKLSSRRFEPTIKRRSTNFSKTSVISESTEDIRQNLEKLEKKETTKSANQKQNQNQQNDPDDEVLEDDYYDEEEVEEGTDYNLSYFDNGEDFIGEDDALEEEGPTF
eukprot:Nk52_evm18s232 gene=Nk52_evmTU18s232